MNSRIVRPTTKLFISFNKGTISSGQIAPEYIAFDLKRRYLTESPPATNNEFIYDNRGVGQATLLSWLVAIPDNWSSEF